MRGDTVLDVGCGTGLSFEGLHERVGARGPHRRHRPMPRDAGAGARARARARLAQRRLVARRRRSAPLQGQADAALFHFTHDVLRDAAALDHVLAHLRPGARVVAAGLQWAPPWMRPPTFVLGRRLFRVPSKAWAALGPAGDTLRNVQLASAASAASSSMSGRLA